jgi:hypothetical protein
MQERLGKNSSFDIDGVCSVLADWVGQDAYLGDAGLVLWALALRNDSRAEKVFATIADRAERVHRAGSPQNSASLGWLLTGLSAAIREGIGGSDARNLATSIYQLLARNRNATTGLFSLTGAGRRKNILQQRLNSRLGSFASQVYPTLGLSSYALATGEGEPLSLARQTADQLCRLQGSEGQWWWIYDVNAGSPAMQYPVYSVHQDGMGPMALLSVTLASGGRREYADAIWKSLAWLDTHPEQPEEELVEQDIGVVWRAIQRDQPTQTGAFGLGLRERLRLNLSAWIRWADQRTFESGFICRECRPYHLGWILVAAALFEAWQQG